MSHEIKVPMTLDNLKDLICKEVLSKEDGSFIEVAQLQDLFIAAESVFKAKDYLQAREIRLTARLGIILWARNYAENAAGPLNRGESDLSEDIVSLVESLRMLEDTPELDN